MANSGAAYSAQSQSALLNQLTGTTAPQTAEGNVQNSLTQDQLNLVGPELQDSTAYNNAMAGYNQAGLENQAAGLGISQLGLQQQGAQNTAQQGIEQQEYGLQSGQYPEQSAEAALAYQNTIMQTSGGQAISGTANTVGGKQQVATNAADYGYQQEDINRAQQLSQLGQQSEQSGYGYSQQELQNAQSQLGLSASANGLSEDQLMTMLNYGNTQAGVGAQQDIVSLLSQLGQGELGQVGTAGSALSSLGFASGFNALAGVG
jgi:hypothetical protein